MNKFSLLDCFSTQFSEFGHTGLTMVDLLSDDSVHISNVMTLIHKAQFAVIYQLAALMT